jgi:hypothetical protein
MSALGLDSVSATGALPAGVDAEGIGPAREDYAFYDGFEDGDYTSDPAWETYTVEGDVSATVSGRDTPDGGSNVLEISETRSGGSAGRIGWSEPQAGWDGEWTLSGLFYPTDIPLDEPFQGHRVKPYMDPETMEMPLAISLGFRRPSGAPAEFLIGGDYVDDVESMYDPGGAPDTWYRYEVAHDGDGTYRGRRRGRSRARTVSTRSSSCSPMGTTPSSPTRSTTATSRRSRRIPPRTATIGTRRPWTRRCRAWTSPSNGP